MPAEWRSIQLGDAVTFQRGFDLPAQDRVPGAVPIVSSSGVSGRHSQAAAKGPGVVTGRYGTIGQVFFISEDYWPLNTTLWVKDFHGNHVRFMSYMLRTVDYWSCSDKSSVPGVNRNDLHRLPIRLPSHPEQRAIASVLGALDDKIDLNRRMCQTLEEMARALFKSWFVENAEAHWKAAPLGEWVEALSGGTPSKADASLWGGALKWISPKAMTSIHADECDDYVTTNAVGNGTKIAPKGTTLVMVRGMGLHDGVRISQAREDVTFNQDVKALVPKKIHPDLLLFAMLDAQRALHQRVESSGHGTGKLPSELLLAHPIKMPSLEEQASLGATFTAFNERIGVARHESRTLAALRDTLLPKLITGELRVHASLGSMQEVAT